MSTYGGRPEDRYEQPSDPWGDADRWNGAGGYGQSGGQPGYGGGGYNQPAYGGTGGYDQPGYGAGGYDQPEYDRPEYDRPGYDQPGYDQPGYDNSGYGGTEYGAPAYAEPGNGAQPEPPERSSTRLLVTIVAVLAVLFAGAAVTFFLTRDNDKPSGSPTAQGAGPSGGAAGAEPTAPTEQTGTPAPESSTEARFAVAGQCLVNDGNDVKPVMRIVACAPNTYQVLARFDGTIDYASKCGNVKGYKFHYYFDAELNSLDYVLCLKKR
jgi:hypothetical protein